MKKREKSSKAESISEAGQLTNTIALLDSTHDFEISDACVTLHQLVEKNEEYKGILANSGNFLKKIVCLLDHKCLSVRRLSCMLLASLSLNATIRKEIRKFVCLVEKLLSMVKFEDDNILKENALLLLSSLASEFSCKVSICDNGGLILLFECLRFDDPDIVKNSLQTLALILQDYSAKMALHSCNNIHEIFGFLFSEHSIIKQLAFSVLIQAAEYAPMLVVMGMKGIIHSLVGCLICSPSKDSLPHALKLLSKCLSIPNIVEEFTSFGGIECLLNVLQNPEEEVAEKKNSKRGTFTKSRKSKEEQTLELQTNVVHGEFQLVQVQEMKISIFECLQRIAIHPKFYRALQRKNLDDILESLLPNIETNEKSLASLLNLLGTLCYYIKSRLFFGQQVDLLVKIMSTNLSSEDPYFLKAVSFFLTNLLYECQKNSKLMVGSGVSEIIMSLIKSMDEEVLVDTCGLICNLSRCTELRNELISLDVDVVLIDLLKSQVFSFDNLKDTGSGLENGEAIQHKLSFQESHALIEKTLVALACLSLEESVRIKILRADATKIIVSQLASHNLKIQKAASLLVSKIAMDSVLAEGILNLCGSHLLRGIQKSRSRQNKFSEHALNQLYKFKPVEKFAFHGVLSYEDEISDGFYDAGQICANKASNESLKPMECYLYDISDRFRPVFIINTKPSNNVTPVEKDSLSTLQDGQESQRKESKAKQKRNLKKNEALNRQIEVAASLDVEKNKKLFEIPSDPSLCKLIEICRADISILQTIKHQIVALAKLVSDAMGGQIMNQYLSNFEWENHINQLIRESILVPIAAIKFGIHFHRALLFKVLADRINIPCSLSRREYNRGFIEVTLMEENVLYSPESCKCVQQVVPERFLVDVIFKPGRLIPIDSIDAKTYSNFL